MTHDDQVLYFFGVDGIAQGGADLALFAGVIRGDDGGHLRMDELLPRLGVENKISAVAGVYAVDDKEIRMSAVLGQLLHQM